MRRPTTRRLNSGDYHLIDVIGFGSLNLDEFWEAPPELLDKYELVPGSEYVRDHAWFSIFYGELKASADQKTLSPGGSAANAVAALSKMGFRTGFIGSAGKHDFGLLRLTDLGQPEDLRIKLINRASGRCLAMIRSGDESRDRILVVLPNANDMAGADSTISGVDCKWLHLTSFVSEEPLRNQLNLITASPKNIRVSFDPGIVYCSKGLTTLLPILKKAEILFITEDELQLLIGAFDEFTAVGTLREFGIKIVVVKKGAQGISVYADKKIDVPVTIPIEIVDRTGAGDVAAAGFLAGALLDMSIRDCGRFAVLAASQSIHGYGREAYPDKAFLERFVSSV